MDRFRIDQAKLEGESASVIVASDRKTCPDVSTGS
jgi:hypothetical protein